MVICKELAFTKVILEGDAQVIINAINCEHEDMSWYGYLVEDFKEMLSHTLEWNVQFISREDNSVAHNLAKATLFFLYGTNVD